MKLALLALPALLAAQPAAARVAIYHAVGTEPGWTLDIGGGSIIYIGDYGKTRITTRTPTPRATFNGRRYVTRRIVIDITRAHVQRRDERPRISRARHRDDRAAHGQGMRRRAGRNCRATRRLALDHSPRRWPADTHGTSDGHSVQRRSRVGQCRMQRLQRDLPNCRRQAGNNADHFHQDGLRQCERQSGYTRAQGIRGARRPGASPD